MLFKFISRKQCPQRMPVLSSGGLILKEETCMLPAGHPGHHRGPSGGMLHNRQDLQRLYDGDPPDGKVRK